MRPATQRRLEAFERLVQAPFFEGCEPRDKGIVQTFITERITRYHGGLRIWGEGKANPLKNGAAKEETEFITSSVINYPRYSQRFYLAELRKSSLHSEHFCCVSIQ